MAKSFKNRIQQKSNPTLQFISTPPEAQQEEAAQPVEDQATPRPRAAAPHRAIPKYEETKSRRLQLLITPTLQEALKAKAQEEQTSVNELINRILSKSLKVRG